MAELIKFRDVNKQKFTDVEHTQDFLDAEKFGKKVCLGKLALYYKDFWKKYCVPYDYIDRAYKAVNIIEPQEVGPVSEYFRLILIHGDKEFANIIFGEKDGELVDRLVHRICEIHPETEKGYVEPPKPEKKKRK